MSSSNLNSDDVMEAFITQVNAMKAQSDQLFSIITAFQIEVKSQFTQVHTSINILADRLDLVENSVTVLSSRVENSDTELIQQDNAPVITEYTPITPGELLRQGGFYTDSDAPYISQVKDPGRRETLSFKHLSQVNAKSQV